MARRPGLQLPPARKVGRGSYKPVVSYVVPCQTTQPTRRRTLDPIEEAEALQDERSIDKIRDWYVPPEDTRVGQTLEQLETYIRKTDIEVRFMSLAKLLLSQPKLPYNPYPGFQKRMRFMAERFHMFKESKDLLLQILDNPTEGSRISGIVRPERKDGVWGLAGIVRALDPDMISRYQWLMETLTPVKTSLVVDKEHVYSNQVMLALLGSCVFHGTLYTHPHDVTVRLEYIIAGPSQTEGLRMFAESIVRDLKHMERNTQHEVISLRLSTVDGETFNDWTVTRILENRDKFSRDVIAEVERKNLIRVQCVIRLAQHSATYMLGEKQYTLTFVKVKADTGDEESLVTFSDLPTVTLHEGVFLTLLHAESYMVAFSQIVTSPPTTGGSSVTGGRTGRRKSRSHTQMDGFRYGTKVHLDPYSPNIIQPIRVHLQQRVARRHPVLEVFDSLRDLILLSCLDRASHGDDLTVEMFRMLHSTAARLHQLLQLNLALQKLVEKFMGEPEKEVVIQVFVQYKQGIVDVFNNTLHERSSDLNEAGRVILGRLDDMVTSVDGDKAKVPLTKQTHQELLRIHGYMTFVFLHLAEDALSHCPKIKGAIASHQKAFPDLVPRQHTPIKRQLSNKKKKEKLRSGEGVDVFSHGVEDASIMKHDKQVINVAACMKRDSAPKTMATESVLLTYVIDSRLDEVWPGFLMDLLSDSVLPPNPYPRLVTNLRMAAARMDCCQDTEERLKKRLLHGAVRLEDRDSFVYHIPGTDAYGMKSALALVDSSVFFQLVALCEPFIHRDFIQRRGPFRVAVCCGVGCHTPMYGRMAPYLHSIHLEEHGYIRGPNGAAQEAMHLYSRIVYDHVNQLSRAETSPLCGVYMGEERVKWTLDIILADRKTFTEEIHRRWTAREHVYLRAYTMMDWRYVAVDKYFMFHYVNVEETEFEEFFPSDPSSLYQLVFFEGDKASFHYQYGGPGNQSDPMDPENVRRASRAVEEKISAARHRRHWLDVHRWLLTRNLITQGSSHVPEVWRMLHSIAGQAEYLITLAKSLQDLVTYVMDQEALSPTTEGGSQVTSNTGRRQRATNEAQQGKYMVGTLDLKALGRMTLAFRLKLEQVCCMQTAMAASSLAEVIKVKVQQVTERDQDTRELFVVPGEKTLSTLEEVKGLLEALRDTTACDLHAISPEAKVVLRTIDDYTRPQSSVSSTRLTSTPESNHV